MQKHSVSQQSGSQLLLVLVDLGRATTISVGPHAMRTSDPQARPRQTGLGAVVIDPPELHYKLGTGACRGT